MTRSIRHALPPMMLLAVSACHPSSSADPAIAVSDAWARATVPGQASGAVYATVTNRGGTDDRLVAIATPRARAAMLHQSSESGGVMAMRMIGDLAVLAGATVSLAPLGTHIMLTGLTAPLRPGERIALTLRFARAGTITASATVVEPGAQGPMR
ncbi:MAG: copper chaperone PCu(A)C [Sphingomicrobium sp.]